MPLADFPRLRKSKMARDHEAEEAWVVACLFVTRAERGQGGAEGRANRRQQTAHQPDEHRTHDALREHFSEVGLIRRRLQVEIEWLKALAAEPALAEVASFSAATIARRSSGGRDSRADA